MFHREATLVPRGVCRESRCNSRFSNILDVAQVLEQYLFINVSQFRSTPYPPKSIYRPDIYTIRAEQISQRPTTRPDERISINYSSVLHIDNWTRMSDFCGYFIKTKGGAGARASTCTELCLSVWVSRSTSPLQFESTSVADHKTRQRHRTWSVRIWNKALWIDHSWWPIIGIEVLTEWSNIWKKTLVAQMLVRYIRAEHRCW